MSASLPGNSQLQDGLRGEAASSEFMTDALMADASLNLPQTPTAELGSPSQSPAANAAQTTDRHDSSTSPLEVTSGSEPSQSTEIGSLPGFNAVAIPSLGGLIMTSRFDDSALLPFHNQTLTVNPVYQVAPHWQQTGLSGTPASGSERSVLAPIFQESDGSARAPGYNVDVSKFIDSLVASNAFGFQTRRQSCPSPTTSPQVTARTWPRPSHVRAEDVKGDEYDMQGINWTHLGASKERAWRARQYYCSAIRGDPRDVTGRTNTGSNRTGSDGLFSFRRMNNKHRAFVEHFQLRNLISVTSHNDIYYATKSKLRRTDSMGHIDSTVMDLTGLELPNSGTSPFEITALDAANDVVVVGSYCGEYAMCRLDSPQGSKPEIGRVTRDPSGIICHVELFNRRGQGRPASAALSSNDQHVRVLDCTTNKFALDFAYPYAINCTSTDPCAGMRLVVGDSKTALVTSAESGETLAEMTHHAANIFAASWCQDGIYVATGAEDGTVLVYDARRWSQPIAEIICETKYPRSLRFSPGGGPSMLLIAEAEDAVSVVEARRGMFERKQVIQFFGSVAGTSWRPDGRGFWVANADQRFGGLMECQRCQGRYSSVEDQEARSNTERRRRSWAFAGPDRPSSKRDAYEGQWNDENDRNGLSGRNRSRDHDENHTERINWTRTMTTQRAIDPRSLII